MNDPEKQEVVAKLITDLEEVIAADYLRKWLDIPNEKFGGRAPNELIASGDLEPLRNMLFILQTGMPG